MVEDWTGVFFGLTVLFLGTVILVVVMLVGASFAKARVARRDEKGLEDLVARYEELVAQVGQDGSVVRADLADVRGRVTEIERMLREVG